MLIFLANFRYFYMLLIKTKWCLGFLLAWHWEANGNLQTLFSDSMKAIISGCKCNIFKEDYTAGFESFQVPLKDNVVKQKRISTITQYTARKTDKRDGNIDRKMMVRQQT